MKLSNPDMAHEASRLLQKIEDEVKRSGLQHSEEEALIPKIGFPTGYIRTVEFFEGKYHCSNRIIRKNIAYTLQFHDVLRWLLNRTDIGLSAKAMIIKYGIISISSVIEVLVRCELEEHKIAPKKKFEKNVKKLVIKGLIDDSLADELRVIHNKRNKIHIELYQIKGDENYTLEDWKAAVDTLENLVRALQ